MWKDLEEKFRKFEESKKIKKELNDIKFKKINRQGQKNEN